MVNHVLEVEEDATGGIVMRLYPLPAT